MSKYVSRVRVDKAELWSLKGPLLRHLDIELTERCNNDCVHCYINKPARDARARKMEMSSSRIERVLSEAAELGCLTVRFTGGEPLLRKDFERLYLFARRLGLKVILFTNATLLSPRVADLLARIPPLAPLEVSLYGMSAESYEAVTRTPNSFKKAWAGVRRLRERDIPFLVKGAYLPYNKEDVEEFEEWAKAVSWTDNRPFSLSLFYVLHARGDQEKNRLIRSMRPSPEAGVKIVMRHPEEHLRDIKSFLAGFTGKTDNRLFACDAGVDSCSVDAYGQLQPCLLVRHPETVYNLEKGSLEDALKGFFPELRSRRASDPRYLERCARCVLKGLCEQCPAMSWMEYGTLDSPVDYFCEATHFHARQLGLIGQGEHAWEIGDWTERINRFSEADALKRIGSTAGERSSARDNSQEGGQDGRNNRSR